MLRPGSSTPVLTWGIAGVAVLLWLVGFIAKGTTVAGLPFEWLVARYDKPLEVWRFVTATIAYPSVASFTVVFSVILGVLFFLLNGPSVERILGRARFMAIVVASGAVGAAAMVLVSGFGFGLFGALFGLLGAYAIQAWTYPPARARVLITIGINLVLIIALGGGSLPQAVGGLVMGAGATYIFQRYEGRARSGARTPYLIIAAIALGFVAIAVIRSLAS